MKLRWIIAGILFSILIHIGIMIALGKISLNLPSLGFIETYIFENKQKIIKHEMHSNTEELKSSKTGKINQDSKDSKNITTKNLSENTEKVSEILSVQETVMNIPSVISTSKTNPFIRFINETMKFDIYWMGIYVGSAVVYVKGDERHVTITSMVKSAGFISNFYYVNDHAESKIQDGKPKHFKLVQVEGKYRSNKETIFDYDKGEVVFINHLKNNTTHHKGIDKVFMDVLSGFFYLRTLQINLKESVSIDIFDSNKFATVLVQPIKEEKIELSDKKQINTIVIKPQLDTEGLFKRKGDIIIWLSRDDSKIPIKIETKIPVGKVVAELREYKKD